MQAGKPRIHYGWFMAAVTFAVLIATAGVRSTPTMFILPLEDEFHWSAATISLAIAINIVLFGLIGPFAAAIMDRIGVRRTVSAGFSLLCIAAAASTQMREPWQLVATWGIMVGIGVGSVGLALGATIANRWFTTNRGTVIGLFSAANATGQLVFLPLFGVIIEHAGWRTCALVVAAVCALAVPLFLLVGRDRPSDVGLAPVGATEIVPYVKSTGNPFAAAINGLVAGIRSRDFWLLAGSFFVCGASTNGLVGTHLVPACGDHGIPEVRAAGSLAAMGVFDLIGTTASGWLSDRYDSRWLLFWYYGLRGLSLICLPFAFGWQAFGLPLFAVFYGLDWIATVPPTLKLTNSIFGLKSGAIMFAWILAGHQIGASVAALAGGIARTSLGTYDSTFVSAGVLCLCAAAMVLFIGVRSRVPTVAPA